MQKAETLFRQKFQKRLKLLPSSWFESIQQKTIQGTPDNIGCIRGCFVAIEYKKSQKDKPTPMQELKLSRIIEAGGIGLLVHPENADNTYEFLLSISKGEI